jgi:ABC-type glycerol-3-phosphate transport system substrate-binding protein
VALMDRIKVRSAPSRLALALIAALLAAACGSSATSSSPTASASPTTSGSAAASATPAAEIVLTCDVCTAVAGNVFTEYRNQLALDFNEANKGTYRIDIVPASSTDQAALEAYYRRLALAGTLPDLFLTSARLIPDLDKANAVLDFTPALTADTAWKDSFFSGILDQVTTSDGRVLGIAEQRDAVGIFWNSTLFTAAGVADFPTSWDGLRDASEKLKEANSTPFAFDSQWVPQVLWSQRIAAEQGGPDFLTTGMQSGDYNVPPVVTATEWLRDYYKADYANSDAYSADFPTGEAVYLQAKAGMLANGPWEVATGIKSANAAPGLYDATRYSPAPGNVIAIVGGDQAWMSGAKADKAEAVYAFMKFATSPDQLFKRVMKTGSFGPTNVTITADQEGQLEPLAYNLWKQSADATTSPLASTSAPGGFFDAWKNNWPVYVQDQMTTQEFLAKLAES